jgi:hypothetical protein
MKIASGPMILARPVARTEAAQTLASGESVFIPAEGASDLPAPAAYPDDVQSHIEAGRKLASSLGISEPAARHLNVPGMAVGVGAGAVGGAAIGVLLTQLKSVHPASAIAFDAACAVLGVAAGTVVGSGQFSATVDATLKDGRVGFTLSPVSAK